ncbi:MAG TPA: xanthine dehydrogenase family protein molybdopterin-binding subunit [Anaerolineales bacterium]|nr:xanthine dehydrogenase family protein molybdopterin-binding subunit [Anaerolineales bacterium]
MAELQVVGKRLQLVDSNEKIMGTAVFGTDIVLPGMLHGKILRSPHAHARILHINTERAKRVPGVRAVVTAADAPPTRFGLSIRDERFFAIDEAHYIGDEVAGVVAGDEDTAEEASRLIEVEYEPLPAIFDPIEAMKPDAPLARRDTAGNVCKHLEITRGDVERGFQDSAVVHEELYSLGHQYQAYIEPIATAAEWTNGRLTLWAPHQAPRTQLKVMCEAFDIPSGAFRLIQTYIGGGFGGKNNMHLCPLVALLAKKAGAPVRVVLTREEDFQASMPSVPMHIRLKMGAGDDGTILAKDVYIIADNGAFTASASGVITVAAMRVDALYRFKNVHVVGDLVYTNKVSTSAFRGFGNTQMHFAVESMMDTLAERLGVDPIEIRLRNATQKGDVTAHGWVIGSCELSEAIRKVVQVSEWKRKRGPGRLKGRGIGIACGMHISGSAAATPDGPGSSAQVRVHEDGSVYVVSSEGDIGQGAKTVFAQIAAEVLGVPYENVHVSQLDTDVSNFGVGAIGSHVTTMGGHGIRAAAVAARGRLIQAASDRWGCGEREVRLIQGKLVNSVSEEAMEIGEAASHYVNMTGGSRLLGEGHFRAEGISAPDKDAYGNVSLGYSYAAHIAEVEIDLETGLISLVRMVAAHDSGQVINPMFAEGQVEGGILQGMGMALSEQCVFKDGRIQNPNFTNYRVPTAMDYPEIEVHFVGKPDPNGPFGAKSIAEVSIVPVAPAIANAVYDAIGVRFTSLPITPQRILEALKAKDREVKGAEAELG